METLAQTGLPPHTLMQRAGLALAQLSMAIAPHSRRIWVACGAGNNGGDGLEAAAHLSKWGKSAVVNWLGAPDTVPTDAAASYRRARAAGAQFAESPPSDFDFCIDALLGVGANRPPDGLMADWIKRINASSAMVLAVDMPSGLHSDTGAAMQHCVKADHTLSLLALKPGLFTADGKDHAGVVWLDDLAASKVRCADENLVAPDAWLPGAPVQTRRIHASHKGSYGDVAVVGGASGMTGAALLAASAALHSGAGRVFVGLLQPGAATVDTQLPELMFRSIESLDFRLMTVVAGCGGGDAILDSLARILSTSARLVIDADAINAISNDTQLQTLLRQRASRQQSTVLTPHPLEAARLMGGNAEQVQNDRLRTVGALVQRFGCTVVLKGSGTVISAPGQTPVINPTGNGRLATAGTGDVLAGMIGAGLAAHKSSFMAACEAVYRHGLRADLWPVDTPLTARSLSQAG
jgi:ADP-dependent NAD(P)H-hydrate dehydratase / NAD(P)H-hydrate epimerase